MNIGIVGLGHLGKIHLKLLNESSLFNIVGIFDIDMELTNQLASQYQTHACDSYANLLGLCDAICIVTPTPSHFELASLAIKNGKHVFIEKPATNTLDDTKKLIRLAREAGVVVQVGHVERFNPAFIAAKTFIKDPLNFEIHRLACYNVRGTDVSVVLDLMIHDIDLLMSSVKSKIKQISATGAAIVSSTADKVNARIEFENGCVANLTANRVALSNVRKIDVFQKNCYILIDLLNKTTTVNTIESLSQNTQNNGILINTGIGKQHYQIVQSEPLIQPINAIKAELDCFHNSIVDKTPIAVSLLDAESALFIAQEIENQILSSIK